VKRLVIGGVAVFAAITTATPVYADGNAAGLDQIVGQAYTQFQRGCTPGVTPRLERVVWDSPPTGQGVMATKGWAVRSRCRGVRTTAEPPTRKRSFRRSLRVTGTSPSSSAEKSAT
jgi:hypothetical protein